MSSSAWTEPAGKRWRVRARVRGQIITVEGSIETPQEAERLAETYSNLVDAGTIADPRGVTLETWGAMWLDRRDIDGVRGIRQERSVWSRYVAGSDLARMPVDAIGAPHVVAWLDEVRRATKTRTVRRRDGVELVETGETISAQTARHALRVVSGALDDAVLRGVTSANAASVVSLPRQASQARDVDDDEGPWTFLSAPEIDRLTVVAPRRRELFELAVYTGLRLGELLELRWTEVDHKRARLRVRRSKSGKPRTVPLLAPARAALERLLELRTDAQRASPLVICRLDGDAYSEGYDARWGDTWRVRVTDRPVRFHDLRHTCASHLVLGTWGRSLRLDEVRAWLGHSSITVTQRYAHLGDGHLDELARTMSTAPELLQTAPKDFTNLSAPPGGLEPPTVGLEGRGTREESREVTPVLEQFWSSAREKALAYLASVGQPHERHAAITLAEAVLEATGELVDEPGVASGE